MDSKIFTSTISPIAISSLRMFSSQKRAKLKFAISEAAKLSTPREKTLLTLSPGITVLPNWFFASPGTPQLSISGLPAAFWPSFTHWVHFSRGRLRVTSCLRSLPGWGKWQNHKRLISKIEFLMIQVYWMHLTILRKKIGTQLSRCLRIERI